MKTLHVLRHTKSDWSDATLDDHDRPLNARGKKARKLIARHVDGWDVDLVVCSTAVRARATADPVIAALGCPVLYVSEIYDAGVGQLLDVLRTLPDDVGTAMLVGHNPGVEQLTTELCGASPRYPTGGLGTIELAVDHWADVRRSCGVLVAHTTPAALSEATLREVPDDRQD
jgi:phosphohistidine phosphatase